MIPDNSSTISTKSGNSGYLSPLQSCIKIMMDYLISMVFLLIMSPVFLIISVLIKMTGKGPVIYSQDRIGKGGKPFSIYKFRSMVYNAESGEPMLSATNEERVTKIGRFLRKYRIDEIPNFFNVLKGEMSVVGPRPERRYFIDQIVKRAPEYNELHEVRPGITSWGQVRFGYASNVDEMIRRLEYDLHYMKHRSLWFDLKIIIYTIEIIFKGKGI
ncbi:MAG: sugar transferase [Bacteroidales bacterium]|jgi:lipopolysaccharide/colanic/teichoic acid biosynthesis glycosyltransferase|nr:sugar transferase [Bacteroidales bacterium]